MAEWTQYIKGKKKKALRHNEYYDMQTLFDELYRLSGKARQYENSGSNKNYIFRNLMPLIIKRENILLAYRNIKKNKGSKTKGVTKTSIIDIAGRNADTLVDYVRKRLSNYYPQKVRRVEIPKPDGRKRPLGIPTMEDRLIQQCIKQILDPILEARFYQHSYGFRPERQTKNAIARFNQLSRYNYHYVVDIDIKGFFDNVNHGKLLKQLWTLGIQDKHLINVISRMLKAEIEGIGVPEKGTPQGGILSPLLANVVLNELDFWIASQWEEFPTKHNYTQQDNKERALKNTNLKLIKLVRYADDFKIMCKDHTTAQKIFIATKKWLKERLQLEISPEKSRITNIRKNYSEFLGLKIKVKKGKGGQYTNRSRMNDKAKEKAFENLKKRIHKISKNPTPQAVMNYNSTVLGLQNYFNMATLVSLDFSIIAYKVRKSLKKTIRIRAETGKKNQFYEDRYGKHTGKRIYIAKIILYPVSYVKFQIPMKYSQDVTRYTINGREKLHEKLRIDYQILKYLMENSDTRKSVEYNDNRISLYTGQKGKCAVTKEKLEIGNMMVHHINPQSMGGTDDYNNLIFVTTNIHILIHAKIEETIKKYLSIVKLDSKGFKKLNQLRVLTGNNIIETMNQ